MSQILEKVKKSLGITGAFQDKTIQEYIDEVKRYLIDGGVHKKVVEHHSTVGVITRGVADLWNYGSGGTSFSPYFMQRAIQLSSKNPDELDSSTTNNKEDNNE